MVELIHKPKAARRIRSPKRLMLEAERIARLLQVEREMTSREVLEAMPPRKRAIFERMGKKVFGIAKREITPTEKDLKRFYWAADCLALEFTRTVCKILRIRPTTGQREALKDRMRNRIIGNTML